jgi:hypothetical protein
VTTRRRDDATPSTRIETTFLFTGRDRSTRGDSADDASP